MDEELNSGEQVRRRNLTLDWEGIDLERFPGGGYFTINSYGGVRRKDFCYDPIPEIWSDIDTQSQKICQILIPNRRSNKSNSTSKG